MDSVGGKCRTTANKTRLKSKKKGRSTKMPQKKGQLTKICQIWTKIPPPLFFLNFYPIFTPFFSFLGADKSISRFFILWLGVAPNFPVFFCEFRPAGFLARKKEKVQSSHDLFFRKKRPWEQCKMTKKIWPLSYRRRFQLLFFKITLLSLGVGAFW